MNRFKKYLRDNCKIRLANEFLCLPFELGNHSHVILEDVIVNASKATVTHIYNVDVVEMQLCRDGILREI